MNNQFIQFMIVCAVLFCGAKIVHAQQFDAKAIHAYLLSQQNSRTGLINSFSNTADKQLLNQSSTYDQALAGMAFLLLDDVQSAEKILRFFDKKWNGEGFPNFYESKRGGQGIESTIHLGPNAWVGILALHYSIKTNTTDYLNLAYSIVKWSLTLNREGGGFAMGPKADWGADWPSVYSVENNLSLYGLVNLISLVGSYSELYLIDKIKTDIVKYVKLATLNEAPFFRSGADSRVLASDIAAYILMIFSAEEIEKDFNMQVDQMYEVAESSFWVKDGDVAGYDFTDEKSRKKLLRDPMISFEWSCMFATAYMRFQRIKEEEFLVSENSKDRSLANKLFSKRNLILENVDKAALTFNNQALAYPYSSRGFTRPFPFAPWWKTPGNSKEGELAGALSSTCWRLFAHYKFNPYSIVGQL